MLRQRRLHMSATKYILFALYMYIKAVEKKEKE
jgi:hypothetical protein